MELKKSKSEWTIKAVVTKKSLEIVSSKDKVPVLTMAWAGREMEKNHTLNMRRAPKSNIPSLPGVAWYQVE